MSSLVAGAALVLACGPQVDLDDDGGTGGGSTTGLATTDLGTTGITDDGVDGSGGSTRGTGPTVTSSGGSTSAEASESTAADPGGVQEGEFEALMLDDTFGNSGSLHAFSRCGPQRELFDMVDLSEVAPTPQGRRFGISGHELVELVDGSEQVVTFPNDQGLEDISWPMGVAWDANRERVVLVTLAGEGFAYAYAPDTQTWTQLSSLENHALAALTYREDLDVFYGIGRPATFGDISIFVLDPEGAVVEEVAVTGLPTPKASQEAPLQLRWHEGELLVLVPAGDDAVQMYTADPGTGEAMLVVCD